MVSEVCGELDLQPVRVRVGVTEYEQISIVYLVDQTNGERQKELNLYSRQVSCCMNTG